MATKRKTTRHPAAIAWDKWLASPEGKASTEPTTLNAPEMQRKYLGNRLNRAYNAGWRDAEKQLLEKAVEALGQTVKEAFANAVKEANREEDQPCTSDT